MKHDQSDSTFDFFHQNEGLLYQFFLNESLKASRLIKKNPSVESLTQLMGSTVHPFHQTKGHIPKMVQFYELHSAHYSLYPKMESISLCLERAYLAAEICLNTIQSASVEHKTSFQNLRREMKKVGKTLFNLAPHYKENPHVLYFILNHHRELDSLYGKSSVANLFHSLFSGGIEELKTVLLNCFSNKGFHHLLPTIEKQVESLSYA